MLAFGAHVTFELVDVTDFKGVMDSRPALACVSLRWGIGNKEHETSACERNASGKLLVEVTSSFQ
jgi:hypothetical protein